MIKIKKNISNKLYYTLLILSFIFILGFGVYAFGTSSPSTFGHSAEEIAGGTINGELTINGNLNTYALYADSIFKKNCLPGYTKFNELCIQTNANFYSTYGNGNIPNNIIQGAKNSFHVCTKQEIILACSTSGSTYWAASSTSANPPNYGYSSINYGYSLLLGDTCGDDCQLYINHYEWCNSQNNFNIDGVTNANNLGGQWTYRICY